MAVNTNTDEHVNTNTKLLDEVVSAKHTTTLVLNLGEKKKSNIQIMVVC